VSTVAGVRSYLPWVRQGVVAGLPFEDTLGAGVPARAQVPLELWLNDPQRADPDARIQVPVRLHAAADVAGIDPREVLRVEPRHLSTDFEPNLFPLIEFDRPDLAWLFTPARANAAGRLRPWIVLVVVEQAQATLEHDPTAPLPVLDVSRGELPDLVDSWAWAHAQVTRTADDRADTVAGALRDRPDHTVSRLLCPRRLRPRSAYLACVVPAFAAGGDELAPAWEATGPAGERIRLPVYYQWEFTTGAGGDFEELVRRLQPRELPDGVGAVPLDLTEPGWDLPERPNAAPLPLASALRPAGAPVETERDVDVDLREALRAALAIGGGPDVAPPLYGQWYTRAPGLPSDGGEPHWLRELNLDPRMRVAAGLGTQVVRYEQERLVADAWNQLAEHEAAAQERTRVQLAEEVAAALHDKHLATLTPERRVQLAAPTLAAAPTDADRASRRLLGPGGAIGRRLAATATATAPTATRDAVRATQQLAGRPAREDVEFTPTFPQPTYELLRDWFEGMLLAGLDLVPPNTIALLAVNDRFVEAFLVGLNHEFARELAWRGFPATRRGTMFRRFWDTRDDHAGSIPEIRTWPAASHLGEHLAGSGSDGQLVLLLRSDLLRRYPRATVTAVEAAWTPEGRRVPASGERQPSFRGSSRGEVVFVGFDLDVAEARGGTDPAGPAGWFFIVQEQPLAPRFGFDEPGPNSASAPTNWDDVTWADVDVAAGAYVALGGRLAGTTLPRGSGPNVSWGQDAAHMAAITQQAPFRLAVHASAWLPTAGDG
jgi:hypothetical protein